MIRIAFAFLFAALATLAQAAPYALVSADGLTVVKIRELETPPAPGPNPPENRYWLPYEIVDPAFDPLTQVRTGPVRSILVDKVQDVWTVRAKTGQELADEAAADQQDQVDRIGEVGFKALYIVDARARKLRGDPPISEATFQNQLKALRNNPIPNPVPINPPTFLRFEASVTIGSVAGATFSDKTFTIAGLQTGDRVLSVTFPSGFAPATVGYFPMRVSAADTLSVRFFKIASGAVTPTAPQNMTVVIWRD